MSLSTAIRKGVNSIFTTFREFTTSVVLSKYTRTFDTDTATFIETSANTNLECITMSFSTDEIKISNGNILVTDKKVIVDNPTGIDIDTSDNLYIDNELHTIIPPIKSDISNSIKIIQARK